MIYSMTGFGKAKGTINGMLIDVEIKALNSKGFDTNIRMPSFIREREVDIRNTLSKKLVRGKLDVYINVELPANKKAQNINEELALQYATSIKSLQQKLGNGTQENILEHVLRMPNVLESGDENLTLEEWNLLKGLIEDACGKVNEYRKTEGLGLERTLNECIASIGNEHESLKVFESERITKIRERIITATEALEGDIQIDNNRLEQELIFYIEKFDLSEEKQRLASHLTYFTQLLQGNDTIAKGKKLNFVSQEIGREINTIGSKANHANIQKHVVIMKDRLEQIKEQLANAL